VSESCAVFSRICPDIGHDLARCVAQWGDTSCTDGQ
jgi:hypothetical protein